MPAAVLEGDRQDVHDGVVQGLAGGVRVVLLGIVRAGADDGVRVMAGVHDDLADAREGFRRQPASEIEREVDQRLRLVFRRVRLRVGLENRARAFAGGGEGHGVLGVQAGQHPRDHAVFPS